MQNYHLVQQWASKISAEEAFKEIEILRLKYPWLRCEESFEFINRMREDLPRILNVIKLQEKQNAMLRMKIERQDGYIKANGLADEVILNELKAKFNIEI